MLVLRSRNSEIDCRRLRALQSCLCLDNGDLVANAGIIGSPHDFKCFLVDFHCFIEYLLQCILAANLKEELGQAGLLR